MALSGIILDNGWIVVSQLTTSVMSVNTPFQFGTIQQVSPLSDRYTIGQTILYNPVGIAQITYEGANYDIVNVLNVLFSADLSAA